MIGGLRICLGKPTPPPRAFRLCILRHATGAVSPCQSVRFARPSALELRGSCILRNCRSEADGQREPSAWTITKLCLHKEARGIGSGSRQCNEPSVAGATDGSAIQKLAIVYMLLLSLLFLVLQDGGGRQGSRNRKIINAKIIMKKAGTGLLRLACLMAFADSFLWFAFIRAWQARHRPCLRLLSSLRLRRRAANERTKGEPVTEAVGRSRRCRSRRAIGG